MNNTNFQILIRHKERLIEALNVAISYSVSHQINTGDLCRELRKDIDNVDQILQGVSVVNQ